MSKQMYQAKKVDDQKKEVPARCEHLLFGWTQSLAYIGKLGVAGFVLIPASSHTTCEVEYKL